MRLPLPLQAAATLSERYLSGRQLPDKAIDVLDTACARVAINLSSPPKQISALTTQSHQCKAEIHQLEREIRIGLRTDTTRLNEIHAQYETAQQALQTLVSAWRQQQLLVQEIIALRQQLLGSLPNDDTVPDITAERDSAEAMRADDTENTLSEENTEAGQAADMISPAERLPQLTAELDALHNTQLLVSAHVDKKQIAAVIAEWTGVPLRACGAGTP